MTHLEIALRTLADDGSGAATRPDLADRVLNRARQRSRRRSGLAIVGAATVAALIAVGVTTVGQQTQNSSSSGPAAQGAATSSSAVFPKQRMNVLLIGSDAAPGRIGVRPDTMILASVDTRTGATTLFGVPRNLERVPFPAGTPQAKAFPHGFVCADQSCLLNALWFWAEQDGAKYYPGDRNPGLTATTQAVEQITGLGVDDTVTLNLAGIEKLVDAVGGVTVTVHERLPIGGSSDPSAPNYHVATGGFLEPGKQHLDGYHALWFARSRWSTDDYSRMARQQCLVTALTQQVDARKLILSYPKIAKALRGNLTTSIAVADLPKWAEVANKMRTAPIQRIGLGTGADPDQDFAKIRSVVAQALAPAAAPSSPSSSGSSGSPASGSTTSPPFDEAC